MLIAAAPLCALVVAVLYCLGISQMLRWYDMLWVMSGIAVSYIVFKVLVRLHISSRAVLLISFVALNFFMLISLLSVPTHPVSDYKAIWESAVAMANGDFDVSHLEWSDYMYIYNWQLGISALESLVIRIFGPEFWSIQLLNVLIVNATAMSVYYFAKEVYADNRRTASFTVLILALFWPFVITVNQFTNQHIAALLILIILILLKRDSVKIWVLAGLLLAILNIVRPMAIVLLIAILLYSLWGVA